MSVFLRMLVIHCEAWLTSAQFVQKATTAVVHYQKMPDYDERTTEWMTRTADMLNALETLPFDVALGLLLSVASSVVERLQNASENLVEVFELSEAESSGEDN